MPRLRVKIVLNKGGEGIPLAQLGDVAEEAEKFLRYLAEDSGVSIKRGDWLARKFMNRSVRFEVEREANISIEVAKAFNHNFEHIDLVSRQKARINGEVQYRTLVQYTKVAKALGPHEKLAFGLYRDDGEKPYKYAPLTKRDAEILSGFLSEEATYKGSIRGAIHDLGVEELWFHLREAKTGLLVKCAFNEDIYSQVVEAIELRHALVYVHGMITARRVDRAIITARVERIKVAPPLSDERYQAFFGADPNYTGQLSADEFIERNRHEH